jgi:hypothetical protein
MRLGSNGIAADCTVQGNTLDSIEAGAGCALRDCTASGNLGTAAICAGTGSVLNNCAAYNNQTEYGIFAQDGSTLTSRSPAAPVAPASARQIHGRTLVSY